MMPKLVDLKCLFIDLDETLLGLPEKIYSKNYIRLVTKHFAEKLDPELFLKAFWEGTNSMLKHDDISKLMLDIFFEKFVPMTGFSKEESYNHFDKFYHLEFSKLKNCSELYPEARNLLDLTKRKKLKVILATNPLYPPIATRERCKWANLDFDEFYYVSHAENSFSCKPNKNYYQHLLEIAEVQPENVLMVGNDYLNDMSANAVGIKTWLLDINRNNVDLAGKFDVNYEGSLGDLIKAISKI